MHLYWIAFPNYLFVVDVLTSFTIWMSIKAFPLPFREWLIQFTAEPGLLSTDQSWRALQAPSPAKSELLGTDAHRDLNFSSPVFALTNLLQPTRSPKQRHARCYL